MGSAATVSGRVSPKLASLTARAIAFAVDSVLLFTFLALAAFAAGLQLLIRSDFGDVEPPDSAFATLLGISVAVVPVWGALNAVLYRWRGQSAGQYVAGIRVVRADGSPAGWGTIIARLLALHPLLFHPFLAPGWLLVAFLATAQTVSLVVLVVTGALVLLSLVSPLVAVVMVLTDSQRRALHDRVAGTMVISEVLASDS